LKIGRWFNLFIYINPLIISIIFVWLIQQSIASDLEQWWNPLKASSTGNMVLQWLIVMIVLIIANKWLACFFNPPERKE